jgi:hypothetical protein
MMMMEVTWQAGAGDTDTGPTCLAHLPALDRGMQQLQLAGLRREGAACQYVHSDMSSALQHGARGTCQLRAASCCGVRCQARR